MLDAAPHLATLTTLPGNRLERLRGDCECQFSIRVNDQWRICFGRGGGGNSYGQPGDAAYGAAGAANGSGAAAQQLKENRWATL